MNGNASETPLQTEKLKEHLALLEKRFSNNGQSKVQNSFQQPLMSTIIEEVIPAVVSQPQSVQITPPVDGKEITPRRQSLEVSGNQQEKESAVGVAVANRKEVSQDMIQPEKRNEKNIWDHKICHIEANPNKFSYESKDFLAEEEKFSEDGSIQEMKEPPVAVVVPSSTLALIYQNKGNSMNNNSLASNQNRLSAENGQKPNQFLSSPSANNIQNMQTPSQNNNNNNQGINVSNSRDKGIKSINKKRKTTQTTLTMTKLRKYDTSAAQQQQQQQQLPYQIQSLRDQQLQMSNRPRLGSDSSNSNEQLLMSTIPPPGNLKITNFFTSSFTKKSTAGGQPTAVPVNSANQSANLYTNTNISFKPSNDVSPSIVPPNKNTKESLAVIPQNNNNMLQVSKKNPNQEENIPNNIKNSSLLAASQSPPAATAYQATLKGSGTSQIMLVDPKLELKYNNLNEDIKNKELQIAEKASLIKYLEQDKIQLQKELNNVESDFMSYKSRVQKLFSSQLLELEKLRREETRQFIAKEKQRLGEYVQTRDCTKFEETWQEGTDFKKIKDRLRVIESEKEELEKRKRNIKGSSRKSAADNESSNDTASQEAKHRINLQLQYLQKEESDLLEAYKSLDHEKFLFIQKNKRFSEEHNSRYGQTWPVLGERYQLLNLLGRGGFSEVYKAFDLLDFQDVACKIHQLNLNWSEQAKANYIKHAVRESKIHSELKHPNIVQLYDTVEIDNNSFATILEYCEGPDLYFYLKKNKILPEKEAKLLIKQILHALKYMNSQKTRIIHYDLKPQNIIFHKGELKISDFGLSKIFEDGQTRMELTSQGVGTYWYLPPETFEFEKNAQISPKVDIWSVGVIFFEMVFGQRPFGNNKSQDQILNENIILKSTQVTFPQKPNVSAECKEFIKNCLTYDQHRRWDIMKACESPYMTTKLK